MIAIRNIFALGSEAFSISSDNFVSSLNKNNTQVCRLNFKKKLEALYIQSKIQMKDPKNFHNSIEKKSALEYIIMYKERGKVKLLAPSDILSDFTKVKNSEYDACNSKRPKVGHEIEEHNLKRPRINYEVNNHIEEPIKYNAVKSDDIDSARDEDFMHGDLSRLMLDKIKLLSSNKRVKAIDQLHDDKLGEIDSDLYLVIFITSILFPRQSKLLDLYLSNQLLTQKIEVEFLGTYKRNQHWSKLYKKFETAINSGSFLKSEYNIQKTVESIKSFLLDIFIHPYTYFLLLEAASLYKKAAKKERFSKDEGLELLNQKINVLIKHELCNATRKRVIDQNTLQDLKLKLLECEEARIPDSLITGSKVNRYHSSQMIEGQEQQTRIGI